MSWTNPGRYPVQRTRHTIKGRFEECQTAVGDRVQELMGRRYRGERPRLPLEETMTVTLTALPKDSTVPWKTKRCLYALAYAFALAGARGKTHLPPLSRFA